MDCSFWIEAKLFIFAKECDNLFCISEKSIKSRNSLYVSKGILEWMVKELKVCLRSPGEVGAFPMRWEGNSVF